MATEWVRSGRRRELKDAEGGRDYVVQLKRDGEWQFLMDCNTGIYASGCEEQIEKTIAEAVAVDRKKRPAAQVRVEATGCAVTISDALMDGPQFSLPPDEQLPELSTEEKKALAALGPDFIERLLADPPPQPPSDSASDHIRACSKLIEATREEIRLDRITYSRLVRRAEKSTGIVRDSLMTTADTYRDEFKASERLIATLKTDIEAMEREHKLGRFAEPETQASCEHCQRPIKWLDGFHCEECKIWLGFVSLSYSPSSVRSEGVHYRIHDENVKIPNVSRGHGGKRFRIEWVSRVIDPGGARRATEETTNLWRNGAIPKRFRALLPDNATVTEL